MSTAVSESTGYGPNRQMSALGYVMAVILLLALLPVLPFVLVGWVLWRLLRSDEEIPEPRGWGSFLRGRPA